MQFIDQATAPRFHTVCAVNAQTWLNCYWITMVQPAELLLDYNGSASGTVAKDFIRERQKI